MPKFLAIVFSKQHRAPIISLHNLFYTFPFWPWDWDKLSRRAKSKKLQSRDLTQKRGKKTRLHIKPVFPGYSLKQSRTLCFLYVYPFFMSAKNFANGKDRGSQPPLGRKGNHMPCFFCLATKKGLVWIQVLSLFFALLILPRKNAKQSKLNVAMLGTFLPGRAFPQSHVGNAVLWLSATSP